MVAGCTAPALNPHEETGEVAQEIRGGTDQGAGYRQMVRVNAKVAWELNGRSDSSEEYCSGFIVGPRAVLTAAHCLETLRPPPAGATRTNWTAEVYLRPAGSDSDPLIARANLVDADFENGGYRKLPPVSPGGGTAAQDHDLAVLVLPRAAAPVPGGYYNLLANPASETTYRARELCSRIPDQLDIGRPTLAADPICRAVGATQYCRECATCSGPDGNCEARCEQVIAGRGGTTARQFGRVLSGVRGEGGNPDALAYGPLTRVYDQALLEGTWLAIWATQPWDRDGRSNYNLYTYIDRGDSADCGAGLAKESASAGQTRPFFDLLGVYRGNAWPLRFCSDTSCFNLPVNPVNPGDPTTLIGRFTNLTHPEVRDWVLRTIHDEARYTTNEATDSAPYGYFPSAYDPVTDTHSTTDGLFACCGDGVCEELKGETYASCERDCLPRSCLEVQRAGGANGSHLIDVDGPVLDPDDPQRPPPELEACTWNGENNVACSPEPTDPDAPSFIARFRGHRPSFTAYCEDGYTLVAKIDGTRVPAVCSSSDAPDCNMHFWNAGWGYGWIPRDGAGHESGVLNPDDNGPGVSQTALLRGYAFVPVTEAIKIRPAPSGGGADPLPDAEVSLLGLDQPLPYGAESARMGTMPELLDAPPGSADIVLLRSPYFPGVPQGLREFMGGKNCNTAHRGWGCTLSGTEPLSPDMLDRFSRAFVPGYGTDIVDITPWSAAQGVLFDSRVLSGTFVTEIARLSVPVHYRVPRTNTFCDGYLGVGGNTFAHQTVLHAGLIATGGSNCLPQPASTPAEVAAAAGVRLLLLVR